MQRLICSGLIFILCLLYGMTIDFHSVFFLCLFLSLSMTALLFLLPKKGCYVIYGIWILAACIQSTFLWFLPVLVFHILLHLWNRDSKRFHPDFILSLLFLIASAIPILYHHSIFSAHEVLWLSFAVLLSSVLSWMSVSYEQLHNLYIHSMDSHTEQNLLLQEKNQSLLARQDAETYAATLKERNRIAREIHDNLGHLLSRSILMTGAIQTMNQSEALTEPLQQLESSLNLAMTSIRESVHNLHDDALNLEASTRQLVQDFQFCPITLHYDMGFEPPKSLRYAFLTITQEALANIIKHSDATGVTITMREHPGLYQLEITDNGTKIVFPAHEENHSLPCETKGMGLQNMQERVKQLNGTILFDTKQGFRIFITIPK